MKPGELVDLGVRQRDRIAAAGLGIMFFLAGISKFIVPEFWRGYGPELIYRFMSSEMLTISSGVFEVLLGLWLISWRKPLYGSAVAFIWILGITVQMVNLGLWDMAIRDFGITVLALYVFLSALGER